jgi:uncharacterized protein (TIGR00369 family)
MMEPKEISFTPTDRQRSIKEVYNRFKANHFSRFLGLELLEVSEMEVLVGLAVQEHHLQNLGFVHGGLLATLADVAMGFAAVACTKPEQHVLTGDLRISYMNPGLGPYIFVRGYTLKVGRRLVFTEAEIYRESEATRTEICKASATMVVIDSHDIK